VERFEPLEVRTIARTMDVEQGDHEAGLFGVASDTAGRLDVFSRRLRLTEHHHQPETRDVQADRNHVGRQRDVDVLIVGKR